MGVLFWTPVSHTHRHTCVFMCAVTVSEQIHFHLHPTPRDLYSVDWDVHRRQ